MMHHLLAIAVLAALYLLFVLVKPTRACGCKGRCGRCKGTGRRFWPGAQLAHAGMVITYRHVRERVASRADDATRGQS